MKRLCSTKDVPVLWHSPMTVAEYCVNPFASEGVQATTSSGYYEDPQHQHLFQEQLLHFAQQQPTQEHKHKKRSRPRSPPSPSHLYQNPQSQPPQQTMSHQAAPSEEKPNLPFPDVQLLQQTQQQQLLHGWYENPPPPPQQLVFPPPHLSLPQQSEEPHLRPFLSPSLALQRPPLPLSSSCEHFFADPSLQWTGSPADVQAYITNLGASYAAAFDQGLPSTIGRDNMGTSEQHYSAYANPNALMQLYQSYNAAASQHSSLMGSGGDAVVDDQPLYINPKQYARILKRRAQKAKECYKDKNQVDTQSDVQIAAKKAYFYESRHLHAMRRRRGPGGKFVPLNEASRNNLSSTSCSESINTSSSCVGDNSDNQGSESHKLKTSSIVIPDNFNGNTETPSGFGEVIDRGR